MYRLAAWIVICGCGAEPVEPEGVPAWFPEDYRAFYQETRDCRLSLEHAARVRILASPDAALAYTDRSVPFPDGSILVKEQFAYKDIACTELPSRFTVMRKLPVGSAPNSLDWEWQDVEANMHELATDIQNCVDCHDTCGKAPQGYEGTCSEEL